MKNVFCALLKVSALAALAFYAESAAASSVTYDFSGTFSNRYDDPAVSTDYLLPSYIQAGVAFAGSIVFDVEGVTADVVQPSFAQYSGVVQSFTFTIAGNQFSLPVTVTGESVGNDLTLPPETHPQDGVTLFAVNPPDITSSPPRPTLFLVHLFAATSDDLLDSTDAISDLSIFSLDKWTFGLSVLVNSNSSFPGSVPSLISISNASGGLASLTPQVSEGPLPATCWLFGSGLLGMFGVARGRQASARINS